VQFQGFHPDAAADAAAPLPLLWPLRQCRRHTAFAAFMCTRLLATTPPRPYGVQSPVQSPCPIAPPAASVEPCRRAARRCTRAATALSPPHADAAPSTCLQFHDDASPVLNGTSIDQTISRPFHRVLWLSVHTFTTIGYGSSYPTCISTEVLVFLEHYVATVMEGAFIAIFLFKFLMPRPAVRFSQKCLVAADRLAIRLVRESNYQLSGCKVRRPPHAHLPSSARLPVRPAHAESRPLHLAPRTSHTTHRTPPTAIHPPRVARTPPTSCAAAPSQIELRARIISDAGAGLGNAMLLPLELRNSTVTHLDVWEVHRRPSGLPPAEPACSHQPWAQRG
jgi:hypothetical protein